MEKIDFSRHLELAQDGFLAIQKHPRGDLYIHNYTAKTQYERYWVPETLVSRGLITDQEGYVRARPFPKFFNVGEYEGPIPKEPFEVYEKMDGSLGVMYFFEGDPHIATRGSFASAQSRKANQILRTKYAGVQFDPKVTYLFEIIYPENRIVVDYGKKEDLVLLGMVETRTGRELPLTDIGLPVAKRYDGIRDLAHLSQLEEDNREGFVIRFESGLRLKFKFEEYVRLHRIMTQISPLRIWEAMAEGFEVESLAEDVPDEFFGWMKDISAELRKRYNEIEQLAKSEFRVLGTRKETAAYFYTCTFPKILFRMLDQRPYDDIIWRMIRPNNDSLVES